MRLVDEDLEYDLPNARFISRTPSVKKERHSYDFTDRNDRTRKGRGPTALTIKGIATTAELEEIEFATGRDTLYTLYYPSAQGDDEDRYYQRVDADPVKSVALSAELHEYTIDVEALDPYAYDADTGLRVN